MKVVSKLARLTKAQQTPFFDFTSEDGTHEEWSIARALRISTADEAKAYAAAAGEVVLFGDKATGQGTIAASLTTYAALATGLIADGRETSAVMSKADYAATLHRGGSMVSKWINLGNVLVKCGVKPDATYKNADGQDYPLWQVLANKGGDSKVSALAQNGATPEELIAELSRFWGPNGARIAGTKARKGKDAGSTPDAGKSASPEVPAGDAPTEENTGKVAVVAAQRLRDMIRKDGADWSVADMSVLRKVLAECVTACGPEVPAATRKRAPRPKAPAAKRKSA